MEGEAIFWKGTGGGGNFLEGKRGIFFQGEGKNGIFFEDIEGKFIFKG